jgi:hypothetical protein
MNSTSEDIKQAARTAAELAKRYDDAYFIFDTEYGPHVCDASYLDSKCHGMMILAVLPNGDVMNLVAE